MEGKSPSQNPFLSIVVASYTMDRFKDICELFDSCKAQRYPYVEVIFVAERSKELYERAKQYTEGIKLPNFKALFSEEELGLSAARNLGIKEAIGDIIAFVDDDALLFPDWAEEMVKTYQDNSIIGVTGPATLIWEDKDSEKWFPDEFTWIVGGTSWMGQNCEDIIDVRNVGGMNYSFRRWCFENYGLHNPQFGQWIGEKADWNKLTGEEVELSLRMRQSGGRIVFNPKLQVYHKVLRHKRNLSYLAKRSYSFGYTRHLIENLYSSSYGDFLGTERRVLKRVSGRLLPRILFKDLFTNPRIAVRKFLVTFVGTLFIGLGYLVYWFKPFKGAKGN